MARLNVNPTRMELARLKKSLSAAVRSHKLLKDKRDELMRRFLDIMREDKQLREQTEKKLAAANRSFAVAGSVLQREVISSALLLPKQEIELEVNKKNVMSVDIPEFKMKMRSKAAGDIFSYGYAFTGGALDSAIALLADALPDMLRIAELEKAAELLAGEIERTRRRVNALEYVIIPDCRDTIRYISMKLDESERANTTRLMKVKDKMIAERIEKRKQV